MKKKAYVIGNNTKKSLSPIIFEHWIKKYNISASYDFIEIEDKNFKSEIEKILKAPQVCGLNITIPFKQKIKPYLLGSDKHSLAIGATNCLTKKDKGFYGSNTDWLGFQNSIKCFEENNVNLQLKIKDATVIGYGGSAMAIIYALNKMGFRKIKVFNRNFDKIKKLTNIVPHDLRNFSKTSFKNEIIINTIPINFLEDSKIKKTKTLDKTVFGYDLVYNVETHFLEFFQQKNQISGTDMLIHQAIPCFEEWFGIKPSIDKKLLFKINKKLKENTW